MNNTSLNQKLNSLRDSADLRYCIVLFILGLAFSLLDCQMLPKRDDGFQYLLASKSLLETGQFTNIAYPGVQDFYAPFQVFSLSGLLFIGCFLFLV